MSGRPAVTVVGDGGITVPGASPALIKRLLKPLDRLPLSQEGKASAVRIMCRQLKAKTIKTRQGRKRGRGHVPRGGKRPN